MTSCENYDIYIHCKTFINLLIIEKKTNTQWTFLTSLHRNDTDKRLKDIKNKLPIMKCCDFVVVLV